MKIPKPIFGLEKKGHLKRLPNYIAFDSVVFLLHAKTFKNVIKSISCKHHCFS